MLTLTGLAMSGAQEEDASLASGLFNTAQAVGGCLGLAMLSVLATSHTDGLLDRGAEVVAVAAQGYQLAFRMATAFAVAALALAEAVLRERPS
ncbi:hypothetical protein ACIBU0_33225 [Streptomyces sp. NPDC049627]|uniref:hypothetical protein n=1 Tax=Streptomyces sp. NPDC049627 TaxID=3365595 RepID=UPI00378D3158